MQNIFKKSLEIEGEVNRLLDVINTTILLFDKAITYYINGNTEKFQRAYKKIVNYEGEADDLQKNIKFQLYKNMLIPNARADVLSLVKSMDDIPDLCKELIIDFSIEQPIINDNMKQPIMDLSSESVKCIEELILAVRSFLKEFYLVDNYVNKVFFYEHEIDKIEIDIRKILFDPANDYSIAQRNYYKTLVGKMADISDSAEYIGEKLIIASIKREI